VPPSDFNAWNIYKFSGFNHKTDKLKFFATEGHLVEDEE